MWKAAERQSQRWGRNFRVVLKTLPGSGGVFKSRSQHSGICGSCVLKADISAMHVTGYTLVFYIFNSRHRLPRRSDGGMFAII